MSRLTKKPIKQFLKVGGRILFFGGSDYFFLFFILRDTGCTRSVRCRENPPCHAGTDDSLFVDESPYSTRDIKIVITMNDDFEYYKVISLSLSTDRGSTGHDGHSSLATLTSAGID